MTQRCLLCLASSITTCIPNFMHIDQSSLRVWSLWNALMGPFFRKIEFDEQFNRGEHFCHEQIISTLKLLYA